MDRVGTDSQRPSALCELAENDDGSRTMSQRSKGTKTAMPLIELKCSPIPR